MRTERLRLRVLNFIGYTDANIPVESEGAVTYVNDPSNGKTIKFNDGTIWVDALGGGSSETADLSTDYAPLEASPEWSLIGANPSEFDINGGFIRSLDRTLPEAAVTFKSIDALNVSIKLSNIPAVTATTFQSFIAARIIDEENFLGFRFYNSDVQVYQKIAGVFTQLDSGQVPNITQGVDLEFIVNNEEISMVVDGVSYPPTGFIDTTLLTPGGVGIIGRQHTAAGPINVTDSFVVTLL